MTLPPTARLPTPAQAQATAPVVLRGLLDGADIQAVRALQAAQATAASGLQHALALNLKTGSPAWQTHYLQRDGLFQNQLGGLLARVIAAVTEADAEHWGLLGPRGGWDLALRCVEFHDVTAGGSLTDRRHYDKGSLFTVDVTTPPGNLRP